VSSPLGAWLLVALAAPTAKGALRERLTEVLGADVDVAADAALRLLRRPHRRVHAAAAVWRRPQCAAALEPWLNPMSDQIETGDLPSQVEADEWARRHTLGLIERFPLDRDPEDVLLLATALATRVSWEAPFELAPASALGADSPWGGRLQQVLRTPADPRHRQFIAAEPEIGEVAVHSTAAKGGLLVTSVIAPSAVPAGRVLSAAHRIAVALARNSMLVRRSLFDLQLGESELWRITEDRVMTSAPEGREERYFSVLPAWEAESSHDLTDAAELGFPDTAAALAQLLALQEFSYKAKQSAVARYTKLGFEAAAVTAMGVKLSALLLEHGGLRRTAEIRFAHPYAVVAVVADPDVAGGRSLSSYDPWHGVPIFCAWVEEPAEA
jgi:hypothetical protein